MKVDKISMAAEIPRYKKRKQRVTPKKADHKHIPEDVIVIYTNPYHFDPQKGFVPEERQTISQRCSICKKLKFWWSPNATRENLAAQHPELPVVRIKDNDVMEEIR